MSEAGDLLQTKSMGLAIRIVNPYNGYYNPMDIKHKQKNTSKETLNIKH